MPSRLARTLVPLAICGLAVSGCSAKEQSTSGSSAASPASSTPTTEASTPSPTPSVSGPAKSPTAAELEATLKKSLGTIAKVTIVPSTDGLAIGGSDPKVTNAVCAPLATMTPLLASAPARAAAYEGKPDSPSTVIVLASYPDAEAARAAVGKVAAALKSCAIAPQPTKLNGVKAVFTDATPAQQPANTTAWKMAIKANWGTSSEVRTVMARGAVVAYSTSADVKGMAVTQPLEAMNKLAEDAQRA